MGAEQIGYLVKGPVKIQAGKIKAAVRACLRHRQSLLADTGKSATQSQRCDAALSATGEWFDPQDIPDNPEPIIREFVEWWHCVEGRDTCSRQDPDDKRQKLVYAGEMSWGDEPQGYGYQKLKQAFAWGYAEALGIR
jgi:hypothetical protein